MSHVDKNRLKVLLIAFACRPGRGSEPKSGWNRALYTQQFCDTWVICQEQESKAAIEAYSATAKPDELPRFVYVRRTSFEQCASRIPGMYYVAYNLWHRRAYRAAIALQTKVSFDIVHQATMCGYREPGYCWRLPVAFVWGPLGGTQNYPWKYLRFGGLPGAIREGVRTILNQIQLHSSLRVRKVANRANVVLAGNSTCKSDFLRVFGVDCKLMTTTGIPFVRQTNKGTVEEGPLQILWSGPHNYGKALFLLIKVLANVKETLDFRLTILGSGPETRRWQRMARRAGIADRCRWTGLLPYPEAQEYFQRADVFAFTSLRDTAANVVLEALAAGVPVVCFDLQGAGDVVTQECGVKIPIDDVFGSIDKYGSELIRLSQDRPRLEQLSRNAIERAGEFSWEKKVRDTAAIYRSVAHAER